jgi:hypothetical protein
MSTTLMKDVALCSGSVPKHFVDGKGKAPGHKKTFFGGRFMKALHKSAKQGICWINSQWPNVEKK